MLGYPHFFKQRKQNLSNARKLQIKKSPDSQLVTEYSDASKTMKASKNSSFYRTETS